MKIMLYSKQGRNEYSEANRSIEHLFIATAMLVSDSDPLHIVPFTLSSIFPLRLYILPALIYVLPELFDSISKQYTQ